jgi:hypothetical protein
MIYCERCNFKSNDPEDFEKVFNLVLCHSCADEARNEK